ncbi:MAG TPA: hypothetical protein PKH39_09310, partial [Woeseiaceae bacterium]|nr:hypothetical protein [Woeseiaceae bacterium]
AAMEGLFDELPEQQVSEAMASIRSAAHDQLQAVDERIRGNQPLRPEDHAQIIATARAALSPGNLSASRQTSANEGNDGSDA